MKNNIQYFFDEQLKTWDFARNNYNALKKLKTKEFIVNGCEFKVQFNSARIASTGAKLDAKSIEERECFLCEENLPKEQIKMSFKEKYSIMVNPFPIFQRHFTVSGKSHIPQTINSRMGDMFDLAEFMSDYVIFYNGPKCGASAPDHAHFQAGNKGFLPLEKNWKKNITEKISEDLFVINYGFPAFLIETKDKKTGISLFEKMYRLLNIKKDEIEPMMNVLTWRENKEWISVVIPRAKHRPECYFVEGEGNMLISPASVDLGGVFIAPLEKDFEKMTEKHIENILNEVCLDEKDFQQLIENF
ncbi:conserved hypothetical protein [uncultured Paludibacter sp.]|uniref:Glycosyltransferase n=1 Tax=uncultured Paludibacter sp. TaxID=497635 RepID=A0A653AHQ7_9BACT|nr:conserved hypothetical protein [uncultured Paludibacter sp.]